MERNFALAKVDVDNIGKRSAMRIYCTSCTEHADFVQTGSQRKPPIAARQYFTRHGWIVGTRPRDDKCPKCVQREQAEARAASKPRLAIVPTPPKIDQDGIIHHDMELRDMQTGKLIEPEKPRAMTIDDRRIVYEAVSDHYVDPATGYEKGWSDKKIGEDLGVPWAWVKEVRTTLFGEKEGITEDVAELRTEMKELANELTKLGEKRAELTRKHDDICREQAQLQAEFSRLNGSIVRLGQRIANLEC